MIAEGRRMDDQNDPDNLPPLHELQEIRKREYLENQGHPAEHAAQEAARRGFHGGQPKGAGGMFDFLSKLEQVRDTLKIGAGRAADVARQGADLLQSAESFLRDVEGGKFFAPSPVQEEKLATLEGEFQRLADRKQPKGATQANAAGLSPELTSILVQIALALIGEWRKRREERNQPKAQQPPKGEDAKKTDTAE